MKTYTLDDLRKMAPDQRAILYQNAVKRREKGGQAIIDLIDGSLPLSSGNMRNSDPAYLKIQELVWSEQGRKAALEAAEKGLPALAGIEPFIVAELGERYHPHDGGAPSMLGTLSES